MKKHLILVKHSLPEIVESRPAREWRLSDRGRARAERLARLLTPFQPEVVVSSHEPKARETAEIVARSHQLETHVAEGLHEHDQSNIPYLAQDRFQASMRELFEKPNKLVFGRESADQAHARFSRAVHSILKPHAENTVVIVAHGTVISLFASRLTGLSDLSLWRELGLPSFVVLDLESKALVACENKI